MPYYINPCDSLKLNPMHGDFSVEEDRPKVEKVLNDLYETKTASYLELGDLMAYRVCKMVRAWSTAKWKLSDEELAVDGDTAIARVKEALKWRDDATEASWMDKQGISLLLCAICLNDRPAVRELLAKEDAAAALALATKPPWTDKERKAMVHRREPFVHLCLGPFAHMTPTAAALAYADAEVFQMVLAAKPPPPTPLLTGKGKMCEAFTLPLCQGDVEPYLKLVAAYPPETHGPMFAQSLDGFSWLQMAMFCLNKNQEELMAFLLENGQGDNANKAPLVGCSPLILAIRYNPEVDLPTMKALVDYGADVNKPDKVPTAMKVMTGTLGKLGMKTMGGMRRFFAELDHGGTPLHHACDVGNIAAVRALVELGANVDAKDRKGARPADVARAQHTGTKMELLVASLEGK